MRLLHIDIETSGLDAKKCDVLSIATLTYDTVAEDVVSAHYALIPPGHDEFKWNNDEIEARRINRISGAASAQARHSPDAAMYLIREFEEADALVGWNLRFDLDFLVRHPAFNRLLIMWFPALCLKSLARESKRGAFKADQDRLGNQHIQSPTPTFPVIPDGDEWKHNALLDVWKVMTTGKAMGLYGIDEWPELVKHLRPWVMLRNLYRVADDDLTYTPLEKFGTDAVSIQSQFVRTMTHMRLGASYSEEEALKESMMMGFPGSMHKHTERKSPAGSEPETNPESPGE